MRTLFRNAAGGMAIIGGGAGLIGTFMAATGGLGFAAPMWLIAASGGMSALQTYGGAELMGKAPAPAAA